MNHFFGRPLAKAKTDRRDWYRVTNAADDTVRVDIYDFIGYDPWWDEGVDAKKFVKDLGEIRASTIDLHINSPGGYVTDGILIYNALRDHSARIVVTVDALAASAASFIAMAGDEVVMNRHSELMIHDPLMLCAGNAEDMKKCAEDLDRVGDRIAGIYAARTGAADETWRAAMLEETWYSAQEAVDVGLANRVIEDEPRETQKAKNRFDLSRSSITPVAKRLRHHATTQCIPPKTNCALIAFRPTLIVDSRRAQA